MELKQFDHIVLTTQDLERCLHFYRDVLGMRVREQDGRYALLFGSQKINIHRRKAEFLPAAAHPVYGSLDLCILADGDIGTIRAEVRQRAGPLRKGLSSATAPVASWTASTCATPMATWWRSACRERQQDHRPGKAIHFAGPKTRMHSRPPNISFC